MGKGTDRLLVGIILGVLLGIGGVSWWVLRHPVDTRSEAIKMVAAVAGALGVAVPLADRVWRARRPGDPRPVDILADLLARGVHEQWRKAAAERMLVTPAPIRLSWSLSEESVGPVAAAIGDPDAAPAFPPLPGKSRVTEEQLRAGGGRGELFAVYAGIASGRMVVVGAPGAGKSGTAVLLLLDALAHRDRAENSDRARVPVPVKFTPHDWDPTICSVQDWLTTRLVAAYPMFQHRGGHAEAAALVAAGAITLILDGFDEMDLARRPAALQALNDATFRVVMLTRGDEMTQAAGDAWLVEAVALNLNPVSGTESAAYLQRARTGPPPSGWAQLLTHLQHNPDSTLTSGLSTPLTLTLIRDTYRPGDDLSALLTATHGSTAKDIEKQLIARVIPEAYKPRPGRPKPRYSPTQAEQALAFLARHMNHDDTRDLAWWHIPRWAPSTPRILCSALRGGLLGGLLGMLILGPLTAIVNGIQRMSEFLAASVTGFAFGLGAGLMLGLACGRGGAAPKRIRTWRGIRLWSVLTAALGYCVVVSIASVVAVVSIRMIFVSVRDLESLFSSPLWFSLIPITVILVYGLVAGLPFVVKRDVLMGSANQDSRQRLLKRRRTGRVLGIVVLLATAVVIVFVLVPTETRTRELVGVVVGVAGLVMMGLVYWLARIAARFAGRLVVRLAESASNPQEPRESCRSDRVFRLLVGLIFGLAVGLPVALLTGWNTVQNARPPVVGVFTGLAAMVAYGLVVGLLYGLASSVTWSTRLAWRQLQRSRCVPAVDLMSFLEDARSRDVLRADGAVYQFRHATLQDHLAEQTAALPRPLRHQETAPHRASAGSRVRPDAIG